MEEIIKLLREKDERKNDYNLKLVLFGDGSGCITKLGSTVMDFIFQFENTDELIEWLKK